MSVTHSVVPFCRNQKTTSTTPQALARSVIRQRFACKPAPVALSDGAPNSIVFYENDGMTPLDVANTPSGEVASISNLLLSPEEEETLSSKFNSTTHYGKDSATVFENGIIEVYGPPVQRLNSLHNNAAADTVSAASNEPSPPPSAKTLLDSHPSMDSH